MKVLLVLALVAAASAVDVYNKPSYSAPAYKEAYAPAYYNFDYAVKDDYHYVDFGHQENRNGDNTKGSYYVVLPDGRKQIVNYHVDGYSGYVADVQYSGDYKAYTPATYAKPAYKPEYKPAAYVAPAQYTKPAYEPAAYEAPAVYETPAEY